jgi:putative membrane protein
MKWIVKIVVVALALLLAQQIVPGISVSSFATALIVALVLGVINLIIRPVLLILTLPITIITFGLFAFILNALLFWLAAALVPGFIVSSFLAALLGSIIVSVAHFIADHLFSK